MIRAVIFDLDGTLVQTEKLKAVSYAEAVRELSGNIIGQTEVINSFKEVVGHSRKEVAVYLLSLYELESIAADKMKEFGVNTPWQVLVQIRVRIYRQKLENPRILHDHACPFNMELLRRVNTEDYRTGLATMSQCDQATKVMQILNLQDNFDFVATRDDVENGKPHPEIYLLVANELNLEPKDCLVIEDSSSGVQAALNAGMRCIAVTNDFTREKIHNDKIIDKRWIVDDSSGLDKVFENVIKSVNP